MIKGFYKTFKLDDGLMLSSFFILKLNIKAKKVLKIIGLSVKKYKEKETLR